MHQIDNPQTPVYEESDSGSSSEASTSLHGSAISTPQKITQGQGSGMMVYTINDGVVSEIGFGPAIWSNAKDDLAVKAPDEVPDTDNKGATSVALPSPPSSKSGQESEIADAVSEISLDSAATDPAPPQSSTEVNKDIIKTLNLRTEWLGTSQVYIEQVMSMQATGHLDRLIAWRKSLLEDPTKSPYDSSVFIDLSSVDCKLGYTDTCVAYAYKALLLIEAGLKTTEITSMPNTTVHVRASLHFKLRTTSSLIIEDELQSMRLEAYQFLLDGLKGCGAYWDGLQEANKALKYFSDDPELLELRKELLATFKEAHQELVAAGCKPKIIREATRSGKIYQKTYPWIDKSLYWRTPALIREVNKQFGGNAEVRSVVWGTPEEIAAAAKRVKKEGEDVGPLGIFATQDIKKDNIILVDKTLLGISDVPSSKLDWCDACHASLRMPYLHPNDIRRPSCCNQVAYCSQDCYKTAIEGYHSLLCGKDFNWIYNSSLCGATGEKGDCGSRWRPIMFTRLMAIVLTDMQSPSSMITHPLQHPLVARMSANYPPPSRLTPESTHHWQFFENVVAPTQILLQLGINIFSSPIFTQEVIQTIYWRLENNANMSATDLTFSTPSGPVKGTKVNHVNINPSYLFFNHSCLPNVTWHGGAVPDSDIDITWLLNSKGEFEKAGCSSVICIADRDIEKGEELKISYVGDPLGLEKEGGALERVGREGKRSWLGKWFDDGCGCEVCEKENEDARKKGRESGGKGV